MKNGRTVLFVENVVTLIIAKAKAPTPDVVLNANIRNQPQRTPYFIVVKSP